MESDDLLSVVGSATARGRELDAWAWECLDEETDLTRRRAALQSLLFGGTTDDLRGLVLGPLSDLLWEASFELEQGRDDWLKALEGEVRQSRVLWEALQLAERYPEHHGDLWSRLDRARSAGHLGIVERSATELKSSPCSARSVPSDLDPPVRSAG